MQKHHQKPFLTLLLAALFALPLNAASAKGFFSRQTSPPPTQINVQQAGNTAQQIYQIMLGEFNVISGNYPAAFNLTLDAAQTTKDSRLFERAVLIAQYQQDTQKALEAAKKWQAALPESKDAHHFTLDLMLKQELFNQITPAIQGMLQASEPDTRLEMIAAMGKYLAPYAQKVSPYYTQAMQPWLNGDNPEEAAAAWTSVAIIEFNAKNFEPAYTALHQAQMLAPELKETALTAIDMINSSHPQAEALVVNYLSRPDADDHVRIIYVQSLLQRQQITEAKEQLAILTESPDALPVTWFLLGSLQIENKQYRPGMQALKTYLEKTQDDTTEEVQNNRNRACLELAQAEVETGTPQSALQWLDLITNSEMKASAQNTYINILVGTKEYDLALKAINQLPEDNDQQRNQKNTLYAQVLMQAERWSQVYRYLEEINAKKPITDPYLLYQYALAASETGHHKQAETLLRNLIKNDPTNTTALNTLGYILAERNTNLEEAKELLGQALKLEPNNPAALDTLGWIEFKRKNTDVALHLLERAYKNLSDPEIAAHYGHVLWVSGQRDQALAVWKMALTQSPDNKYLRNTFKQLGVSLATVRNFELTTQITAPTNPNPSMSPDSFPQLVEHLYMQQDWQKLYDVLTPFNASNKIALLLNLQAHAASELGRFEEAEKLYLQAIEAEPEKGSSYNNLGYMLISQNVRLEEARTLIEKANLLEPNHAAFLDSLGWVEFKLGNNKQAIAYLRQAYHLNPEIAEIGTHLGEVLWTNGSKAEALLIWKDLQYKNPQGSPEYKLLEETLKRLQVKLP
ncbi:MAG: tetratricopeptide repeat protein [Saezia sp.]